MLAVVAFWVRMLTGMRLVLASAVLSCLLLLLLLLMLRLLLAWLSSMKNLDSLLDI
jgi:hypothetical protein